MRYLAAVKPLLLLIAALFGVLMSARQVYVSVTEKEPTEFTAENFAAQYAGQQWISVKGRLAVEAQAMMPSHRAGGAPSVYIPLVPENWQPQDTVHVIVAPHGAGGGNFPGQATVTGVVRPLGGLRYGYVFPRLKFASPTVTINENSQPMPPWGMGGFLALCLALCAFAGWRVATLLRP
jgi:hypothetical protein